jgi:uncharacterized membrane protein (DUF2068 family)
MTPSDNSAFLHPPGNSVLQVIAVFEVAKGLAAIAISAGLVSLAHHDLRALAAALIGHFHLDPNTHYLQLFLAEAEQLTQIDFFKVLTYAAVYAVLRFAEAYGLWRDRAWAEWLAASSGAVYLPIEVTHLRADTSAINAGVLGFNILIVVYMCVRLWRRRVD